MKTKLEIIPGKWKPVFKTPADYEAFRKRFIAKVTPRLKELDRARTKSSIEAQTRWVD